MEKNTKEYEKLELTDDFMFSKVMRNKELCRELLEIIMGFPIADITYLEEQKVIDISADAKGVRLDVYAADENRTVYDVEMQNGRSDHLPKRSRYYQSMIDLDMLEKGVKYKKLNPGYVIFICTFDLFGENRYVYTFENRCLQNKDLSLGDEVRKIFLNANGTMGDISEDMKAFLHYLSNKTVETEFVKKIDKEVQCARKNKEWRHEYMRWHTKVDDIYDEAMEEGLKKGREKGLKEGLKEGLKKGREEGLEIGREEGLEKGREEGLEIGLEESKKYSALTLKLLGQKRYSDLEKAASDSAFRKTLYKEWGIE